MNKIILLLIFFSTILLTTKVPAQNKFHLGFNGGYVFQGPSKGLFNGGDNAWTIDVNINYSISSIFRIGLQTGYFSFANYTNYYVGAVPTLSNIVLPPGSYNYSTVENTSAKVYQVALGITFENTSSNKIHPFGSVYSGLYFFRYIGDIILYWTYQNQINYWKPVGNYYSLTRGFASIAAGYQFPIVNSFNLNLQAVYTFTFDRSNKVQDFIPVLCGVEYSF
jgi:hypothetical protein